MLPSPTHLARLTCLTLGVVTLIVVPWTGITPAILAGVALAQWAKSAGHKTVARILAVVILAALLPGFASYVIPEALISTGEWLSVIQTLAPGASLASIRPPLLATLTLILLTLTLLLRQRPQLGAPLLLVGAVLLVTAQLACRLMPAPVEPLLNPGLGGATLAILAALTLAQLLLARHRWHGHTRLNRSLLPSALLILALLAFWHYQYRQAEDELHATVRAEGATFIEHLSDDVQSHLDAMERFSQAWRLIPATPTAEQWRRQAANLHNREFRYLINISFVSPDKNIDYVYPDTPTNVSLLGKAARQAETRALRDTLNGGSRTSTDIIQLLQGEPGLVYYLPVRNADEAVVGAACMVISLPLLADTLFAALNPEYALWSWKTQGRMLTHFGSSASPGPWQYRYQLPLPDQSMDVIQRPRRDYLLSRFPRLPAISLTIGLLLAYLLYMVLYTFHRLGEQNVAFRRSNARLQEEIDERQRLQEEIEWLARHDELTGLANRRCFLERIETQRDTLPLSLILCDIDHFKRVNDRLGHLTGDKYLEAIAGIGQAIMAENGGFFARYGGEEFIGCLPGTDHAQAMAIAETLRRQTYRHALAHEDGCHVSLSAGVATYTGGRFDLPRLMQAADEALYRAKAQGRNRVASTARNDTGT